MATKIIEIKKKNADGSFTKLIPQTASSADYGMYASTDTSKGTIESRLTAVETVYKTSMTIESGISVSTNEIKRLRTFVVGKIVVDYSTVIAGTSKKIGIIPQGFRPKETQSGAVLGTFKVNVSGASGNWTYLTSYNISTSGEVTITTTLLGGNGSGSIAVTMQSPVTIAFGYETMATEL